MNGATDVDADELMTRVGTGDREALAALFAAEAGRLVAVVRRLVRRVDLAEEVVQETFVTAWQKAPAFDRSRGGARGWLTTIARNKALNMLRDGSRIDHADADDLTGLAERGAGADRAYALLPDTEALKTCLDRLDEDRRRCVLLAYVGGYTHEEIAGSLGSPVGTVKAWIRRSVIALQECLS